MSNFKKGDIIIYKSVDGKGWFEYDDGISMLKEPLNDKPMKKKILNKYFKEKNNV